MNATFEQGILPALFIEFDEVDSVEQHESKSKRHQSDALGEIAFDDLSRILTGQRFTAGDKQSVAKTVFQAYAKKAGFGPLSAMLQAHITTN